MCNNNINIKPANNPSLMCEAQDVKKAENICPIDQKQSTFIKIEPKKDPPKEDTVSISFNDKSPKSEALQSISFVENKEKEKGISAVLNDITTFGPVKIDKISVPTPINLPGDNNKDKKNNSTPPLGAPGTVPQQDTKQISLKLKVEF